MIKSGMSLILLLTAASSFAQKVDSTYVLHCSLATNGNQKGWEDIKIPEKEFTLSERPDGGYEAEVEISVPIKSYDVSFTLTASATLMKSKRDPEMAIALSQSAELTPVYSVFDADLLGPHENGSLAKSRITFVVKQPKKWVTFQSNCALTEK